jgi:hypothetical protein
VGRFGASTFDDRDSSELSWRQVVDAPSFAGPIRARFRGPYADPRPAHRSSSMRVSTAGKGSAGPIASGPSHPSSRRPRPRPCRMDTAPACVTSLPSSCAVSLRLFAQAACVGAYRLGGPCLDPTGQRAPRRRPTGGCEADPIYTNRAFRGCIRRSPARVELRNETEDGAGSWRSAPAGAGSTEKITRTIATASETGRDLGSAGRPG